MVMLSLHLSFKWHGYVMGIFLVFLELSLILDLAKITPISY